MPDKYQHLAAQSPESLKQVWGTPEPGTFFNHPYKSLLPNSDLLICRLEMDDRDRLLGFAMIHMAHDGQGDELIAELDTRHGEVHIHHYRQGNVRTARSVLRIIRSQEDVELGYDEALDVMTEKWEEHRRRWQHGQ